MIEIKDKLNCCGCEACANICPKHCITMKEDEWGFLYPKIDAEKCIDCNLCNNVCPFVNKYDASVISANATQSKDEEILKNSSSGGMFTTLSKYVVKNGGISIGAQYRNKEIVHTIIESIDDIGNHSGSKYVQSHINDIYIKVQQFLKNGKVVLFSGTPCQVNALNCFLKKKYVNLYTVDFACAGVSSPKVFSSYIEYMEKKYGKIQKINFRYKTYGYHSSTMYLKFANAKEYYRSRLTDYMTNIWTSYIAMRPSCSSCKTKGSNRSSDLTLFECWHFNDLTGVKDDNRGWTNVLVNTKKGMQLFNDSSKYLKIHQVNYEKALALDGNTYYKSATQVNNKNRFFSSFNRNGLVSAVKKYSDINFFSYVKELLKPILYKTRLLTKFKRIFSSSRC